MNIACPYQDCQQPLEISVDDAGAEALCPTCRRPMQLPALASFPADEANAGQSENPFGSPAPIPRNESKRSAENEKMACCPQCVGVYNEKAQDYVREIVELKETGAKVGELRVACECGTRTRFDELLWIGKNAAGTDADAGARRETGGIFVSQPPPSRRDKAKQLIEDGLEAVNAGDSEIAHAKWTDATQADTSWSVPFFNLAKLSLDRGDRYAASVFLGMAEDRAQKGASPDDAQIIQQLPDLKSQIELSNFED